MPADLEPRVRELELAKARDSVQSSDVFRAVENLRDVVNELRKQLFESNGDGFVARIVRLEMTVDDLTGQLEKLAKGDESGGGPLKILKDWGLAAIAAAAAIVTALVAAAK